MVKGNGKPSKKGKAVQRKESNPTKDQGHAFKCVPLSVNVIFEKCTKKDPQKMDIVEELGFGSLQYLPNYYLKHKVLMQLFKRFNTIDNTTLLQGRSASSTQPRLQTLHQDRSPPYSISKTRERKTGFSIHNFLLEEIKKAKENNASSVSGCCFALIVSRCRSPTSVDPILDGRNSLEQNEARKDHGLIRKAILVDERQEKSKKKGKKGSSSTSEPEYVDSSHESESEYEADSEQTMSQVMVQRHRRNDPTSKHQPLPRRAISRSDLDDGHTIAEVMSLAYKKRKGLEEEGSKSKRPKKGIDVPRVDSSNASLGDNKSNAASGNLHQENDEQPQQPPPHQSPSQEDEPPHHQPPPQQQPQQPQQPPPQQSPPQEEEPPHHEPPPQQQQHQPSKQNRTFIIVHQHERIDISSGSEAKPEPIEVEPEPTPIRVLVPKTEADMQYSPGERLLTDTLMIIRMDEQRPPQEEVIEPAPNQEQQQQQQQQNQEPASQSVVEMVPVFPTQKLIEVSSGSDDEPQQQLNDAPNEPQPQPQLEPIKMLVPKTEEEDKLITEVLISMADYGVLDPQPETQPDPSAPTFGLNLGFSTPPVTEARPPATLNEEFPLTARTMAVINNMDELVSAPQPTTATPQPTQAIEDDFDDRVATWAMVPKGGNDYEPIFKLRGPQFLQAIRYQFMSMEPKSYIDIGHWMFFTYHHNWMDKKKRRPHEINSLINHKEYLEYIDREKLVSHRFVSA
ncbi:hypothetical protein PIB30_002881 [Stylosanthes scabra]|uniref:Uncharacterized protein n=1 Tax=Stylosanthes scabra TaxID=79078 RepID=A0ABU6U1W4_9FABA|nr:hypothetical protein [Stylosanthes scabra]